MVEVGKRLGLAFKIAHVLLQFVRVGALCVQHFDYSQLVGQACVFGQQHRSHATFAQRLRDHIPTILQTRAWNESCCQSRRSSSGAGGFRRDELRAAFFTKKIFRPVLCSAMWTFHQINLAFPGNSSLFYDSKSVVVPIWPFTILYDRTRWFTNEHACSIYERALPTGSSRLSCTAPRKRSRAGESGEFRKGNERKNARAGAIDDEGRKQAEDACSPSGGQKHPPE